MKMQLEIPKDGLNVALAASELAFCFIQNPNENDLGSRIFNIEELFIRFIR
jgi:hypothetical protein